EPGSTEHGRAAREPPKQEGRREVLDPEGARQTARASAMSCLAMVLRAGVTSVDRALNGEMPAANGRVTLAPALCPRRTQRILLLAIDTQPHTERLELYGFARAAFEQLPTIA